jgi:hypothetical protein
VCAAVGVAVPIVSTPEDTGADAPSGLKSNRPLLVGGLVPLCALAAILER